MSTPILLVDDDPSVRRSLGRLLRAHGYDVLDAERMSRALEILATTLPALMVVDMVMPGSSTLEAVRQLKANPSTATLPIVALTASPPSAPQDRALFAEVVAKPTDARALLDVIAAILRNGNAGTSTA
ncbi:MAG TPA: response regulator [Steroidobacteraceae bacterium]|nr:response regulator [Steroidobacteraceae bacterium]